MFMSTISIYSQFAGEYLGKDKSFFCVTQVFYGIHFRNIYNTFRRNASMYLIFPQLESDKISFKQSSENRQFKYAGIFPSQGNLNILLLLPGYLDFTQTQKSCPFPLLGGNATKGQYSFCILCEETSCEFIIFFAKVFLSLKA